MKTAEEWCTQFEEALAEEYIKAIQLDAWKQGMTDAAALVTRPGNKLQAIIDARDAKKDL